MSSEKRVDWKSLLQSADWKTFTHNDTQYRAASYNLDGGDFVAIHKFVGSQNCPETEGWAGYQWCVSRNDYSGWPSKELAQKIIAEPKIEQPAPIAEPMLQVPPQNIVIDGVPIPPPGERRY